MTDEKIKPVADGYWWCQNCKNEIGAYHVTNQELHEDCGHPAEWITPVSALAQAREEGRQAGLREAWRTGAVTSCDGKSGIWSSNNVEVEVSLREALAALNKEQS
jgi:hypothetical protein